MIQGTDFVKLLGGAEGCFRITITDPACSEPRVANVEVNSLPTRASNPANQNVTDSVGVAYTTPFVVHTQGIILSGENTSLAPGPVQWLGYNMRFG